MGDRTVTATDGGVSGSAQLVTVPGMASHVNGLTSVWVVADGVSTVPVAFEVTDACGNGDGDGDDRRGPRPGLGASVGPASDNGDGTYTTTLTAGLTVGTGIVRVTDGSLQGTAPIDQTYGPPATVALSLDHHAQRQHLQCLADGHGDRCPGPAARTSIRRCRPRVTSAWVRHPPVRHRPVRATLTASFTLGDQVVR